MGFETPSDRARRAAPSDVGFTPGTDRGSNIFTEYSIFVLLPMVINNIFINIYGFFYVVIKSKYTVQ